ncbi:MAG: cytochrome c [Steroidobacteraceae bacterium]
MNRFRRRILAAFLALPILAVLAAGAVYGISEWRLHAVKRAADFTQPIPAGAATVERGHHLARTRGCFGCHGKRLEGHDFGRLWAPIESAVAPNLAAYAQTYDAATLEAAIRQGIGADGRALWAMPSYNFARLNDEDVAAMIAFLRSVPVVDMDLPEPRLGWIVRWQIASGQESHMVDWVADVPPLRTDADAQPALARGEYLAMTTCNECHGIDLRGAIYSGGATPDLAIVSAYPEEEFRRLLSEGVGIGGRTDLGLMSEVAKERFAHFTEQEFADLRAFLLTLAQQPVPPDVRWRRID